MRRALAAVGPASAAAAWERYADLALWSTWSPQIAGVEVGGGDAADSHPRLRPDLRGTVLGRGGLRLDFVVETVDAPRAWTWTVRPARATVALPAPLRRLGALHLEHTVAPRAGGCLTTLVITGIAVVVLAYAPLAQLALHRLVR